MSGDPMKLVKFVCVAKAHAHGHSDSALTIYEGAWAFCPMGADGKQHDWRPSDGLPLTDALRFTARPQAPTPSPSRPARAANPGSTAAARGKARPR